MEDVLTLLPLVVLLGLMLAEFVRPARTYPAIRWWRLRGIAALVCTVFIAASLPLLTDEWLGQHRLIDATGLGTLGGAVVGLLSAQFASYWWHRTMHRTPVLWRWFHQMHHSPERIDVYGALYFHPLDAVGFAMVSSLALVLCVGISGEAALIVNTVTTLLSVFQHANIRTPQWLGYLVQRPEGHNVHHQRDVHAFNYGDIALWDLVFGTFKNPRAIDVQVGFYDGASNRVGALLCGRDIAATTRSAEASRGPVLTPRTAP